MAFIATYRILLISIACTLLNSLIWERWNIYYFEVIKFVWKGMNRVKLIFNVLSNLPVQPPYLNYHFTKLVTLSRTLRLCSHGAGAKLIRSVQTLAQSLPNVSRPTTDEEINPDECY